MVAVEKGTFYSGEKGTRKIGVDSIGVYVFPYDLKGDYRTNPRRRPTSPDIVNPAESGFIHKHDLYSRVVFTCIEGFTDEFFLTLP